MEFPEGLHLATILEGEEPCDAFVSNSYDSVDALPQGAIVGTCSLRRRCQLLNRRPDLVIRDLRGNVNTRLAKLDNGEFDAIVLACAGLERLGMAERIGAVLSPDEVLPAAAQGVVGIECREGATELAGVLGKLEDASSKLTTTAERAVARRLEANCQSPVASWAERYAAS